MTTLNWKSLDIDYSRQETRRGLIERYLHLVGSGDVRLQQGRTRTEEEQRKYLEAGLAIKLPGQR